MLMTYSGSGSGSGSCSGSSISVDTFTTAEGDGVDEEEEEEDEDDDATAESPLLPSIGVDIIHDSYFKNNNNNNNNNKDSFSTSKNISTKAPQQHFTNIATPANPSERCTPSANARKRSTGSLDQPTSTSSASSCTDGTSSSSWSSSPLPLYLCRKRNSTHTFKIETTAVTTITTPSTPTPTPPPPPPPPPSPSPPTIATTETTTAFTTPQHLPNGISNSKVLKNSIVYNNNNYTTHQNTPVHHRHEHNNYQQNPYPQDSFTNIDGFAPKPSTKMQTKVDAVGRITGEWGKWQLRTVLLIFLCKIPSSWFMACIIFTAPAPRHGEFFCKPPNTVGAKNQTMWIKVSHPQKEEADDQEFSIDFCNVYQDALEHAHHYYHYEHRELEPKIWEEPTARNANVIPCNTFQHEAQFESVITQYDLVCSRDILVSVTQFFHLFGVLTGGILANHLLKYFSPRHVMLFGMITQIICGNLTGHVASYELHVFFRCLSAVCCAQMYTAGGMIMADITGGKYKTCVSTLFEQFWSIGVILLPGVASFFSSWTHLYMAISWPTLILIYLWRWIPDSPRWMITRGRVIEAKEILLQCVEVNGTRHSLPHDIDQQLQLQAMTAMDAPPPAGWWSLWKGEKAVRHMVCVHLSWAIYIVVYYGMLLNIRSFSRDHLEVNTAVAGSSEIIGTFIGLFLILKTSRKWLWAGLFNIVAGFVAFLSWLVPSNINFNTRVALLMLLAMVSKIAISTTLSILTTCTVELVSDEKKKICAFSTICWARFWLLGAPFIGATVIFGQLVPLTAFASLAIIGGALTALITSPRTVRHKSAATLTTNMATATQMAAGSIKDHDEKGFYTKGHTNPVFTSVTNLTAPHTANLPPELLPGIWTIKNQENPPN